MSAPNIFSKIVPGPPDVHYLIRDAFYSDPTPSKVYIGSGEYRTNDSTLYNFQVVKECEKSISLDPTTTKEYLPIEGLSSFNRLSRALILGPDCAGIPENRVATIQSLAGAGALVLASEFLASFLNPPYVYVSDPTWGNHHHIFGKSGHQVRTYPYWDRSRLDADFEGMMEELARAPAGSVVVLHASAHNPTGVDPSTEMWDRLAEFFEGKDLVLLFDCAYQGFADGDLERDAYSIRSFVRKGFQCLVCHTFSQCMGLYSDRIGALHVVCSDEGTAGNVLSQLKVIARGMYSSPPIHGALVVERVLGNSELRERWTEELRGLHQRVKDIRKKFYEEIVAAGVPGDWSHISRQVGMFAFTGLTTEQCDNMINKWHCYILRSGRLSIVGLTTENVNYVARAIKDSVENY